MITQNKPTPQFPGRTTPAGGPSCAFRSFSEYTDIAVSVTLLPSGKRLSGIHIVQKSTSVRVHLPANLREEPYHAPVDPADLTEWILAEHRRQILKEAVLPPCATADIRFSTPQRVFTCLADLTLPHKAGPIRGFRVRKTGSDDRPFVSTPEWMGRWSDERFSWYSLCALISDSFNSYLKERQARAAETAKQPEPLPSAAAEPQEPPAPRPVRETNPFGRVRNAENSPLIYYPRTVLRLADSQESTRRKGLPALVWAINNSAISGIGVFEISLLEMISRLRYATTTLLLDLIEAGYISYGLRTKVSAKGLGDILKRMMEYGLINLSVFKTVNEDGSLTQKCKVQIVSLGEYGGTLLKELGKSHQKFNEFDVIRDSNTVKRYLTANQWLIHFLKNYKEEIGENYETARMLYQKGGDYTGARIFASVTLMEHTLTAEPVRRVEEFEVESHRQDLLKKLERLIQMFANLDQLYQGFYEAPYAHRPILVLLCEDDEHMEEIAGHVTGIAPADGSQAIWFTTDLRTYNDDKQGQRFFALQPDGSLQTVDTRAMFRRQP